MSGDGPIYHKYDVSRRDGAEADPESKHFGGCFHWVLDVDHDPFAVPALIAYAAACERTHPQLAESLRELVDSIPDRLATRARAMNLDVARRKEAALIEQMRSNDA